MQFVLDMMPMNASEHGGRIDQLILLIHWLMAVLFVGWTVFFLYIIFRFRKGRNPKADPTGVKSKSALWSAKHVGGEVPFGQSMMVMSTSLAWSSMPCPRPSRPTWARSGAWWSGIAVVMPRRSRRRASMNRVKARVRVSRSKVATVRPCRTAAQAM